MERWVSLKSGANGDEEIYVPPKTRLDPVVRLKEQREQLSLRALADSTRQLNAAHDHLAQTRARAAADVRRSAQAADWLLTELSHTRALSDVRHAEQAVHSATAVSTASRDKYKDAHAGAEALRKLTALRIDEINQKRDLVERKEMDEFSMLRRRPEAA